MRGHDSGALLLRQIQALIMVFSPGVESVSGKPSLDQSLERLTFRNLCVCVFQIALDMISPQLVLPTVTPHLHPGAVCAVYLAK